MCKDKDFIGHCNVPRPKFALEEEVIVKTKEFQASYVGKIVGMYVVDDYAPNAPFMWVYEVHIPSGGSEYRAAYLETAIYKATLGGLYASQNIHSVLPSEKENN